MRLSVAEKYFLSLSLNIGLRESFIDVVLGSSSLE